MIACVNLVLPSPTNAFLNIVILNNYYNKSNFIVFYGMVMKYLFVTHSSIISIEAIQKNVSLLSFKLIKTKGGLVGHQTKMISCVF